MDKKKENLVFFKQRSALLLANAVTNEFLLENKRTKKMPLEGFIECWLKDRLCGPDAELEDMVFQAVLSKIRIMSKKKNGL